MTIFNIFDQINLILNKQTDYGFYNKYLFLNSFILLKNIKQDSDNVFMIFF